MDFRIVDSLADYRAQAEQWVADNVDLEWAEEQHRNNDHHTWALHRVLAADGWLAAGWPEEYGGDDKDPKLAQAIFQQIARVGLQMHGWSLTNMVCRTLLHVGSETQKRNIIGGSLRGEILISLGYTEPDSGSDAAAAKTRATRDGDEWVIDGQKMFTSNADLGTHVFLLTRSNLEVPKHDGLTMFILPLDLPGIAIQPIPTVGGQRTTATFYSDVRVPDECRVGEIDGGWDVMRVALIYERGGGGQTGTSLVQRVARWAQEAHRPDGTAVFDDPTVRERLVRIAIDNEVASLLGQRVVWVSETGGMPGVEGSMAKLFGPESVQRHHWVLLDILGEEGGLNRDSGEAPLDGAVEAAFREGIVGTIYGGSSEIIREIIAQRHLGLPRNRPSDRATGVPRPA